MVNNTFIYIGDDLLDLDPATVITINVQSVNVGDLKARNVSYTNQFKVRATENNTRIFGFTNSEWSRSSVPYQYNACKVVQNGIETLPEALCILSKYEKGFFVLNIYEDLFDIFAALEGLKLKDIDPIADTEWNAEYMDSVRNSTSGIIAAIVQWGHSITQIFEADFFLPSFYYHSIVTSILQYTGLTLSGDILTDARFTDLVIPFPGDEFDVSAAVLEPAPVFVSKGTWSYSDTTTVTPNVGTFAAGDLLFLFAMNDQEGGSIGTIQTPSGWTLVNSGDYNDDNPTQVGNGKVFSRVADGSETFVTVTRTGDTGTGHGFAAQIYAFRGDAYITVEASSVKTDGNGAATATWPAVTVGGPKRTLLAFIGKSASLRPLTPTGYTESSSDSVTEGYQWCLELNTKEDVTSDGAVTASAGTFAADGWLTFHVSIYNATVGDTVDWNLYWPDIEVKDILKDFFVRFAIVAKQKRGVLYLKTIDEIIEDRPNAVDWSGKLVKDLNTIDFLTDYAQENYFDYVNGVNDPTIGRGILTIANETLPPIENYFESVFASVLTQYFDVDNSHYFSAELNVYTDESTDITDIEESPPFTLLTLKDPEVGDADITFLSTARSDYKIGYFIDAGEPKDSGFQYFIDQFYPKYEFWLQKNKVIEKQYILNEYDIYSYDPHKIIWDGEGYYLINKIKNFVPGKITKVELFKVG